MEKGDTEKESMQLLNVIKKNKSRLELKFIIN